MSGLAQALPFALAAAVYPPAIIVCGLLLTGDRPRLLLTAYFLGATLSTVTVGIAGLALLDGAGATQTSSRSTSAAVDIVVGVVLLAVAVRVWHRRDRERTPPKEPVGGPGRVARLSERARSKARWAMALGVLMYLPSPLYIAAIKQIADTGGVTAGNVIAILICAACVMLFVEVPLLMLFLVPDGLEQRLEHLQAAIVRKGRAAGAVLACAGGLYLLLRGIAAVA